MLQSVETWWLAGSECQAASDMAAKTRGVGGSAGSRENDQLPIWHSFSALGDLQPSTRVPGIRGIPSAQPPSLVFFLGSSHCRSPIPLPSPPGPGALPAACSQCPRSLTPRLRRELTLWSPAADDWGLSVIVCSETGLLPSSWILERNTKRVPRSVDTS